MVCLGFDPWTERWPAQTNPLSYGVPRRIIGSLILTILDPLHVHALKVSSHRVWFNVIGKIKVV